MYQFERTTVATAMIYCSQLNFVSGIEFWQQQLKPYRFELNIEEKNGETFERDEERERKREAQNDKECESKMG